MERVLLRFCVCILLFSTCQCGKLSAQDSLSFRRHELSISLGFGSNMADKMLNDLDRSYRNMGHDIVYGQCFDLFGESFFTLNFQYSYRLNKCFSIGLMAGWGYSYDPFSEFKEDNDKETAYGIEGHEQSRTFYVAPSIKYIWHEKKNGKEVTRLYSGIALGYMREHCALYSDDQYLNLNYSTEVQKTGKIMESIEKKFCYQLNVFGIDIGKNSSYFFGELGYGMQGVLVLGYKFTF